MGKYDPKLLKEPPQSRTAIRQPREFDSVPIHILEDRAFAGYYEFPQSLQVVHLATDKLDQFMCVIDRARIDNHAEIIPGRRCSLSSTKDTKRGTGKVNQGIILGTEVLEEAKT
jgi:hypothetical protein